MLTLIIKAEQIGVTNLRPDDTESNPFWYMFKVQCTSCRETHDNYVGVNRFETNEMSGSRGEANFVWRCKNCKRESSASIKAAPAAYAQTEPPKPHRIIEFDCRGLEFTEFKPEGEWLADGTDSGTKFTGIDLSDGEWYDYDEKAGDEVSVKDISWEIHRRTKLNVCDPSILQKMASQQVSADVTYLTDAAHLLRQTAPETSAHLMRQRADLMYHNDLDQHEVQRQHVCGACGHIMIPGEKTLLKLEPRKVQKGSKKPTTRQSHDKPALVGPTKIITCGFCNAVTKISLPAPEAAARRSNLKSRTAKRNPATGPQEQKLAANASSKKRAKNRKGGLQALLSGQQQKRDGSLSLMDFMK
ncbi:hypothetical protein QQS21_012887 [Conoideocrella luteorostrata]|uniref:DUF866-domain-containing protein n=1 Tax=Conoideocrella luteorostrata TaxID=1105319 RepID=A0AAJ0FLX6_9HYPO|nr:hypothetical protein QQS21_012887 [Conoideocrella luteorostrata]